MIIYVNTLTVIDYKCAIHVYFQNKLNQFKNIKRYIYYYIIY